MRIRTCRSSGWSRCSIRRSLSRHPLFQVMLAFETEDGVASALQLPKLTARPQPVVTASAKFDLSVGLVEHRGPNGEAAGIEGVLEYAADLFDRPTVEVIGQRLVRLLMAAVADASRPIGSLAVLDADERATILEGWNDTAQPVMATTLPALFAAQAARTPDATAVVFEDRTLSYAALDAHANRLAQHLQGLGVGPDVLVGVCAERSVELVVGLVAVLKAGGAYVPLDPEYPAARLTEMMTDAGLGVVLTQRAIAPRLALPPGPHCVLLDDATSWASAGGVLPAGVPSLPPDDLLPRHLAYMIYTSG